MKFVMSFSTGKDSMLALHRMVKAGHEPVSLLVMFNKDAERSWFHGADDALLAAISDALDIPLIRCVTTGDEYIQSMERSLKQAKSMGAEACVFGDIDIKEHRVWNEQRCAVAGLKAVLPLWEEKREKLARESIREGYKCIIKCIQPEKLPESFLGRVLDEKLLSEMAEYKTDLCGENGEYHTIVTDGPLFKHPVDCITGKTLHTEHASVIELICTPKGLTK